MQLSGLTDETLKVDPLTKSHIEFFPAYTWLPSTEGGLSGSKIGP